MVIFPAAVPYTLLAGNGILDIITVIQEPAMSPHLTRVTRSVFAQTTVSERHIFPAVSRIVFGHAPQQCMC